MSKRVELKDLGFLFNSDAWANFEAYIGDLIAVEKDRLVTIEPSNLLKLQGKIQAFQEIMSLKQAYEYLPEDE